MWRRWTAVIYGDPAARQPYAERCCGDTSTIAPHAAAVTSGNGMIGDTASNIAFPVRTATTLGIAASGVTSASDSG
jgi:hypothetical protein